MERTMKSKPDLLQFLVRRRGTMGSFVETRKIETEADVEALSNEFHVCSNARAVLETVLLVKREKAQKAVETVETTETQEEFEEPEEVPEGDLEDSENQRDDGPSDEDSPPTPRVRRRRTKV